MYGGGGDDTLKGDKGNDYLEGGAGTDTYIINHGDGTDTVVDTDGLGVLEFGTVVGTVVAKGKDGVTDDNDWIKVGNSWIDQQNGLTYLLNGTNTLHVISDNGSAVTILGWSDGRLGITLGAGIHPEAPLFDGVLVGDDGDNILEEGFAIGNYRIEGGAGEDILGSGSGNDVLLGGADSDLILGPKSCKP